MKQVTESLRHQAETQRLAHLLACSAEELGFLAGLTSAELRQLRRSCQDALIQDYQPLLPRFLSAVNLLPSALIASIGESTLGPLICARVCSHMSLPRIASLCRHASPAFMAQACKHMTPGKLAEITDVLPLPMLGAVTQELVAQRQFIILGEVVELVPREVLQPLLANLQDGEAMLHICFFIEHPARLHMILELMSPQQGRSLLEAAANPALDLLPHALALVAKVFPIWQRRLMIGVIESPDLILEGLLQGVVRHALWREALPVLEYLPAAALTRVMALQGWQEEGVLTSLLAQAKQPRLRALVEQMVEVLPSATRAQARRLEEDVLLS